MTKSAPRCASQALVESAFDGRLDRGDLAAIERHVAGCETCTAWVAELERLRAEVRSDPSPAPSPFDLARGRLALLRRAAEAPGAGDQRAGRAVWAVAFALAACIAIVFVARRTLARLEAQRFANGIPLAAKVTVLTSADADLHATSTDGRFDLALVDGTVSLWVRKLGEHQRVLVTTSDAIVEVRGTIFRVTAAHGKLVDVGVDGGVVEVRRGDERRLIHAGEAFDLRDAKAAAAEPPDEGAASAPTTAIAPTTTGSGRSPGSAEPTGTAPARAPSGERIAATAPSASVAARTSPALPEKTAPTSDGKAQASNDGSSANTPRAPAARPKHDPAADDFARAVGDLDHADYPGAAARLSSFVKAHPNDARAEDAAFLAVVALQKTGRRPEMMVAARDYLRRFPNGARSADVRRWVEAP